MAAYTIARFTFLRYAASIKNTKAYNVIRSNSTRHASSLEASISGAQQTLVVDTKTRRPEQTLSKSMKIYLQRAREHEAFMKQQIAEYEIGKRHLANMMGADPVTFSDAKVKAAIKYLFPSGLFDKQAWPMMEHPQAIYQQPKAAQFDETGRPHQFLFYTTQPQFYKILYNIAEALETLRKQESEIIGSTGQVINPEQYDTFGSAWMTQEEISTHQLVEKITEEQYNYLIVSLQRVLDHPLSGRAADLLNQFRKQMKTIVQQDAVLKLQTDAHGRRYVYVGKCSRKTARAEVTIREHGTGKISINGQSIRYFKERIHREQIIFPLITADMLEKVDIEATVTGGGPTGQAGAIRWGIAWGLRSFVSLETMEKMRLAGLLTRDWRRRERKKPGQAGARKKFTWKKR